MNKIITATIDDGASLSGATYLKGLALVGIQIPSNQEWTNCAGDVSFQSAPDGSTYGDFKDASGTEVSLTTPTVGQVIPLDPIDYISISHIKVRSGLSGAAVTLENQEATPDDFYPYYESESVSAISVTNGLVEITMSGNMEYIQAGDRVQFESIVGGINAYMADYVPFRVLEVTGTDKFTLDVDASGWASTEYTSGGDIANLSRWEVDFPGDAYLDVGDMISLYDDTNMGTLSAQLDSVVAQTKIGITENWLVDMTDSDETVIDGLAAIWNLAAGYSGDGKAKKLTKFVFNLICRDLG